MYIICTLNLADEVNIKLLLDQNKYVKYVSQIKRTLIIDYYHNVYYTYKKK